MALYLNKNIYDNITTFTFDKCISRPQTNESNRLQQKIEQDTQATSNNSFNNNNVNETNEQQTKQLIQNLINFPSHLFQNNGKLVRPFTAKMNGKHQYQQFIPVQENEEFKNKTNQQFDQNSNFVEKRVIINQKQIQNQIQQNIGRTLNNPNYRLRNLNQNCFEILNRSDGFYSESSKQNRSPDVEQSTFIDFKKKNSCGNLYFKPQMAQQKVKVIACQNAFKCKRDKKKPQSNSPEFLSVDRSQGNSPFHQIQYKLANVPQIDYNVKYSQKEKKQQCAEIKNGRELYPFSSPHFIKIQSDCNKDFYEKMHANFIKTQTRISQSPEFIKQTGRFNANMPENMKWMLKQKDKLTKKEELTLLRKQDEEYEMNQRKLQEEIKETQFKLINIEQPQDLLDDYFPYCNELSKVDNFYESRGSLAQQKREKQSKLKVINQRFKMMCNTKQPITGIIN